MIFSCVCKEEKLRAVEESDKILLEIKIYNKKKSYCDMMTKRSSERHKKEKEKKRTISNFGGGVRF
jgi:hypothetical protein